MHEVLDQGLPRAALTHLYENVVLLHSEDFFERALGMSRRTLQRAKTRAGEVMEETARGQSRFVAAGGQRSPIAAWSIQRRHASAAGSPSAGAQEAKCLSVAVS